MTGSLAIREATAADDDATVRLLERAGLSTRQPAAIAFYRSQPNSRAFVGTLHDRVAATGLGVIFGEAGWVGNIAVDDDVRRRGFGTAMTEAVVRWLQANSVRTALLTATPDGSRVYERVGFVHDRDVYGTWIRRQDERSVPRPSGVVQGDLQTALALDRSGSGEDRGAYLSPFAADVRVAAGRDGYRIGLPWGAGPIVAATEDAGRMLMKDLVAHDPHPRIGFPDANVAAVACAQDLGFVRMAEDVRMRLGPPVVGFDPRAIFGLISFVCG